MTHGGPAGNRIGLPSNSSVLRHSSLLSRREICFDGISTVCSDGPSSCGNVSSAPRYYCAPSLHMLHERVTGKLFLVLFFLYIILILCFHACVCRDSAIKMLPRNLSLPTRRMLLASFFMYSIYHPSRYLSGSHLLASCSSCHPTCILIFFLFHLLPWLPIVYKVVLPNPHCFT